MSNTHLKTEIRRNLDLIETYMRHTEPPQVFRDSKEHPTTAHLKWFLQRQAFQIVPLPEFKTSVFDSGNYTLVRKKNWEIDLMRFYLILASLKDYEWLLPERMDQRKSMENRVSRAVKLFEKILKGDLEASYDPKWDEYNFKVGPIPDESDEFREKLVMLMELGAKLIGDMRRER